MVKNIVLLCDGTWQSDDMHLHISNIAKIDDVVVRNSAQVVRYQTGIGTGNERNGLFRNVLDLGVGGAFGYGIGAKIIEMCMFLSEHYEPGDKIFLFGFSRGAATARALSNMINKIGILPNGSNQHAQAYERFVRGSVQEIGRFRSENNVITGVRIQFLGVFDTVSALGFPTPDDDKHFFGDLNLKLHKNIVAARHALAVDEHRGVFPADVWTPVWGVDTEQRWFVGSHADVGGGYRNSGLSNITLQWMLRNAVHYGLQVDSHLYDLNAPVDFTRDRWTGYRPNWNGKIHNSLTFMYRFVGFLAEFRRTNYRAMMRQADETIDESVAWRIDNCTDYVPMQLRANRAYMMAMSNNNLARLTRDYRTRMVLPNVAVPDLPIDDNDRRREAERQDAMEENAFV